jgi:hypothetical protein
MTFPYNTTLPNPPDDPADDVGGMQVNTLSISQLIAVDHVGFSTPSGGYHNQVSFAINQAAPGLGSGVGELFTNIFKGNAWPFFQNALGTYQLAGASAALLSTDGYIVTSGLVVQWGRVTGLAGAWPATGVINLNASPHIGFPAAIFAAYNTMIGPVPTSTNERYVYITSISVGAIGWGYSGPTNSTNDGFYWLAIGR